VPSGLSKDEWESIKSRDAKRDPGSWATVSAKRGTYEGKDLAKTGITKFNWVPMRKWIEDGQEHQFSAQLMDPSLRNKGVNVNWQQQPYMRAGSKKRPPVAEQFKRAIRDTMAGQNAAAGGTWLEGFLNDGLDEERENKPQPKKTLRYSGFIAAPRHMPVPAGKTTQSSPTALNAYVPSGLSKDEWESIKSRDAKRDPGSWATVSAKRGTYEGKDLAKTGITKFNWVPMRKWIEDGQEHQFSAQLMDPSLRNKGVNVNWQQQPYMRAGSKKRPPVAEQFKRAIRDTMAGQNAAAGGTWLEGFLNDGLDEERENKQQPKKGFGFSG